MDCPERFNVDQNRSYTITLLPSTAELFLFYAMVCILTIVGKKTIIIYVSWELIFCLGGKACEKDFGTGFGDCTVGYDSV